MVMGDILNELDRMVGDEKEASVEKVAVGEKDSAGVDDIMKHIEAVEAAADFIDAMTPGENGDVAFDAEVALRKALGKMRQLSDEVYDEKKEDEPEEAPAETEEAEG